MNLKYVKSSRLNIAYLEDGPEDGPPALCLHGFPDDATAWQKVMVGVASGGYRVLAPFVRGCGESRFLNDATPRAGDFPALGQDALDFVDALDLRNLTVVGQDWGSPTAEIVALERPERVKRIIKLNWYGVYSMAEMAKAQTFSYPQLRALWYVWMLNTPIGEMALRFDRAGLARALWSEWSPSWNAAERENALSAVVPSFEGDDWMRVALSAYRANTSGYEFDPADETLRERLKNPPPVQCDVLIMYGVDDGVERSPLSEAAIAQYFPSGAKVKTLTGVGHFPQREAPEQVIAAILEQ